MLETDNHENPLINIEENDDGRKLAEARLATGLKTQHH